MAKRKSKTTLTPAPEGDGDVTFYKPKPEAAKPVEVARARLAAVGPSDTRKEHYWRGVVDALEGKAP